MASTNRFGIAVGHATDAAGATGCTVVMGATGPLRASAAALGRATGTREFALLEPWASNERVDAILLTGGSAYGLDAAAGVMRWMEERGRGYAIAGGVVPIVPAAVVFDLAPLGSFAARPTPDMAYAACDAATESGWAEGSVGVGTGCTVGKLRGPKFAMKGGVGTAEAGESVRACAIAAVNAVGHIRDLDGTIIASARNDDGSLADCERLAASGARPGNRGANTTIAVVAFDHVFSKLELHRIARVATGALARRIGPFGSPFDGDVVFAVCATEGPPGDPLAAEVAATHALELSIVRAVKTARGRGGPGGLPGLAD
ncbi:MAG: peptidase S58 family protein [Gemmatimonadetes bacterium]|nr:peptidase S58 family protein [Gemmatimonadota bacterium]